MASNPYAPCRNDEHERVAVELKRHQLKMLKVRTALQHVRLWFQQSASANAAADVHAGVRVPESSVPTAPAEKRARKPPPQIEEKPPRAAVKRREPPPSSQQSEPKRPTRMPPPSS